MRLYRRTSAAQLQTSHWLAHPEKAGRKERSSTKTRRSTTPHTTSNVAETSASEKGSASPRLPLMVCVANGCKERRTAPLYGTRNRAKRPEAARLRAEGDSLSSGGATTAKRRNLPTCTFGPPNHPPFKSSLSMPGVFNTAAQTRQRTTARTTSNVASTSACERRMRWFWSLTRSENAHGSIIREGGGIRRGT
ncbi:hypothetical protein BKA81DRAFT_378754 [Phyllosticta paracitricarpa]